MRPLELQENLKKFTCVEECPVRNVIARFSGKWQMLVLCVLAENETTRFNAIGKAIPDISPKVLTDTLKNLERDNLVSRSVYAEIPPRVEYSLTELGRSLMPVIGNIISWAIENFEKVTNCKK
ncbi:MAG: helix-turn-helix transcriptional regulator [Bacteroides sp.]|nr:helix-turn-helix transcriptional regulator [Bacteroides sp.]